jgi:hypothetical protein
VPDPGEAPRLICSARGCRREAAWALLWNNPRLHTPQRRKTWLGCDEHRDTLGGFLTLRGFLRETVPAAEAGQAAGDGTVTGSGAPAGTEP